MSKICPIFSDKFRSKTSCAHLRDSRWLWLVLGALGHSAAKPEHLQKADHLKRKNNWGFFFFSPSPAIGYEEIPTPYLKSPILHTGVRGAAPPCHLPPFCVSHTSTLLFTLQSQVLRASNLCYFAVDSSCLISHVWHLHLIPFPWQGRTASGKNRYLPEELQQKPPMAWQRGVIQGQRGPLCPVPANSLH